MSQSQKYLGHFTVSCPRSLCLLQKRKPWPWEDLTSEHSFPNSFTQVLPDPSFLLTIGLRLQFFNNSFSLWASKMFSSHDIPFLTEQGTQKSMNLTTTWRLVFIDRISEVLYHYLCCKLLATQTEAGRMCRG